MAMNWRKHNNHNSDSQNSRHLSKVKQNGQASATGFTLMEVMVVVAVLGVLAALGAPLFIGVNKPLQNATDRMEGVFRQVRMRAISTTTAYRIRQTSPTQIVVEASTTRGCEASTQLTAPANATDDLLTVGSTRGFSVGDRVNVGSLSNRNITGIDDSLQTIRLGAPLGAAQVLGAQIELASNWQPGSLTTGITTEDLTLPRARNSAERIQLVGNPNNWTMCFDSRGLANLYNPATGRPINGGLTLSVFRADSGGTQVAGTPTGSITILQGGGVSSNARTINE
jgi:prepilin-type N-terminal cleavage/methylation domain-containing protein